MVTVTRNASINQYWEAAYMGGSTSRTSTICAAHTIKSVTPALRRIPFPNESIVFAESVGLFDDNV